NGRIGDDSPPFGTIRELPDGKLSTGPLNPIAFIRTLQQSKIRLWTSQPVPQDDGSTKTSYTEKIVSGAEVLTPGGMFPGVRSNDWRKKLDFLSLMIALFCGTASLPHILIRYYTVKDQASARKSTVVGIASIGFFYVLTLFLGLGAMTSGTLNV